MLCHLAMCYTLSNDFHKTMFHSVRLCCTSRCTAQCGWMFFVLWIIIWQVYHCLVGALMLLSILLEEFLFIHMGPKLSPWVFGGSWEVGGVWEWPLSISIGTLSVCFTLMDKFSMDVVDNTSLSVCECREELTFGAQVLWDHTGWTGPCRSLFSGGTWCRFQ